MGKKVKRYNALQKLHRLFKLNMAKLFRSPGGAKKVSRGFAVGFGMEMLVISTACLIYILLYPAVKLLRASLPAAIIGNVVAKLTFLPIILLPFAKTLGAIIYPKPNQDGHVEGNAFIELFKGDFSVIGEILHGGLHIIIGMTVFGSVLGFISYYVILFLYNKEKERRRAKKTHSSDQDISIH
ncbi:uncharacterized protein (DUF2062 family) [Scopulibacillus darangshiensis]|uniref:Uncharacterized protein (DUF2062 family) n=1 Tax=Scopulibacillus darangshiensis TaxID=442528 RepID=A0A4R2NM66_9BACL|nr:DUF2062 domain-containing protein [Scopulibacillus darangshiensis]TCP22690.1 uncharacterized protein (DUF2062 family) [Scopulibacillus darangshiensis]